MPGASSSFAAGLMIAAPVALAAPASPAAPESSDESVYVLDAPPAIRARHARLALSVGSYSFIADEMRRMYGEPRVFGLRLYEVLPTSVQFFSVDPVLARRGDPTYDDPVIFDGEGSAKLTTLPIGLGFRAGGRSTGS